MSQAKTERLLNLVMCLLTTRRFLTAAEIRATVPGYGESDTAFKRTFERDKEDLRTIGIPVEVGSVDLWRDEVGYRIAPADYELPTIELQPDEAAVLGLAARAWRDAALGGAAAGAVLKLRAAGVPVRDDVATVNPVLDTDEPAFLDVWRAVRDRRPVSFDYRPPGRQAARRNLHPWGIANRRGHWYVAGYDTDRGEARVFRLSRIEGVVRVDLRAAEVRVPPGADVRTMVRGQGYERDQVVVLRVRGDSGHEIRRSARRIVPGERSGDGPGWDTVEYPFGGLDWLVGYVASFGDRVVVAEPAEARTAVAEHLRTVAERDPAPQDAAEPEHPEQFSRTRSGASAGEESNRRLVRLLTLVPYALSRPDVQVAEMAAHFRLSETQVLKDLSLLWMCGLPGYTPGDLIEVDMEAAKSTGEIIIGNAETIAKPLRLTTDEAAALSVGLRLLGDIQGAADQEVLNRTRQKLQDVAGVAAQQLWESVDVRLEGSGDAGETEQRVNTALAQGRRLHLRYYVASRDEITERDVDPMSLAVFDGWTYLDGWCRLAGEVRRFRLDRVYGISVLPVAAAVPEGAQPLPPAEGPLPRSATDRYIALELRPSAAWVAEEYQCRDVRETADGETRVLLRTPDTRWVRRLMLRLGGSARVLSPADLADQVREDARRALAPYVH